MIDDKESLEAPRIGEAHATCQGQKSKTHVDILIGSFCPLPLTKHSTTASIVTVHT